MPEVVTHRYDPARGACLNVCRLSDFAASEVLDRLRRGPRPTLKANYLARRRRTEEWLVAAASEVLERAIAAHPAYFFLGDFSFQLDPSRPAALMVPLSSLPPGAITFTLGDSMSVAEARGRRVYKLREMEERFRHGEHVAGFGLTDKGGFQARFIEVQLWDKSSVYLP